MGEVTLPFCLFISLPKAIFVIARLVGPFSEKNCDRGLENAVSQFFVMRTDPEPDVTKTGNGEWGMGNGEWGMGNGEWGMGNGEWGMGNG